MFELLKTRQFVDWLDGLRDKRIRAAVQARLERLRSGLPGDTKPVGGGVTELRIHLGAGYRVYYGQVGTMVLLLLAGGDKRTQDKDIKRAAVLLQEWKEQGDGIVET
ncbi:MAG: type II toxin-antitoxin system RelE/ParE family toxin [Burkholderiales bacterium]|jgi:putative addiction module killer protein|nr:type II toxin-antitoxin system RelE/ParE family toxin [Burkholderiales bacterium]